MKKSLKIIFILASVGSLFLSSCKTIGESEKMMSINIIDRNGLSETISSKDRLDAYQKTDFLSPQPYQKVMRVYGRDKKGNTPSQITSYHPNGQIKQYLEASNNRALGSYKEWFSNGQLKLEANIIGGMADINSQAEASWLFDGPSKAWGEEGNLLAEIYYTKGELQGESKYFHPNGKIWKLANYQNNFLHGPLKIYLEDGSLFQTAIYQNGVKQGLAIRYWKNDSIAFSENYEKGLLLNAQYFDKSGALVSEINEGNGFKALFGKEQLQELHEYKEGLQQGLVKIFNDDLQLARQFFIKNGQKDGEEIDYFSKKGTGKLQPKLLISWHEGVIQGPVKTWYENGNLETHREISQNKKNGLFTAWYKNGSLMFVEEYDNDKLIKGEYFRINEKIPASKIDRGEGIALLHDNEGIFLKKITYKNGKPEDAGI